MGAMSHYTDKEFLAVCDGMVKHLQMATMRGVRKQLMVTNYMKSSP